MPIGLLFWILMILWLVFGFFSWNRPDWRWGWAGNVFLLFVLFFLLGWHDFGFILQGGHGSPF